MKINISLSSIPLSKIRPMMALFNRLHYSEIFNKYGTGKGKDKYRIYIPITSSKPDTKPVVVPKEIQDYLAANKMSVVDYKLGTALMPDGKRQVRIGRVLKDPMVLKAYEQDPQRSAAKSTPAWVVISRHPYDILGMSFDRGWTSCMDLEAGSNKHYLVPEIKNGTLVAYLVKNTDRNINSPSARIALKVYKNANRAAKHDILMPSPVYGTADQRFRDIVRTFCSWTNSGSPDGTYKLAPGSYDDLDMPSITYIRNAVSLKKLSLSEKIRLAGSEHTDIEILLELAVSGGSRILLALVQNAAATDKLLHAVAKEIPNDTRVMEQLLESKAVGADTLSMMAAIYLADGEDEDSVGLLGSIAAHENTEPSVLVKLAAHEDSYVRRYVAGNLRTPVETLAELTKDSDRSVQYSVVRNTNLPEAALYNLAISSKDVDIRASAARHTKNPDLLTKLLTGKPRLPNMRSCVLNPVITDAHLQILVSSGPEGAEQAASCQYASEKFLITLIHSLKTDEQVRSITSEAAYNPGATAAVLTALYARGFEDDVVRMVVSRRIGLYPVTPEAVALMLRLAEDSDPDVQSCLFASTRSLPLEVLFALADSKFPEVCGELLDFTLSLSSDFMDLRPGDAQRLAGLKLVEEVQLKLISRLSDKRVMRLARMSHSTSVILELSRSPIIGVRTELAGNPNIPISLLKALAEDANPNVRKYARMWLEKTGSTDAYK